MILNQISLEFKWHKLFLGLHSHLKISKLSQVINILYSSTLVLLRGTGPKITQAWTIFSFIQAQTKLHYGATQQQGISESVNSSPFRHKLKLFRKIITTEKIYSASLKGYIHIFHTFSSVQLKDWNKSSKKHFMCFHCSLAKTTVKFSQKPVYLENQFEILTQKNPLCHATYFSSSHWHELHDPLIWPSGILTKNFSSPHWVSHGHSPYIHLYGTKITSQESAKHLMWEPSKCTYSIYFISFYC